MKKLLASTLVLLLALALPLTAQPPTFPVNGPRDDRDEVYAFTNATVWVTYLQKLENATLIVRKGRVESVGVGTIIPKGALVYDLKGKWVYPAFIDLYSNYGMPEPQAPGQGGGRSQEWSNQKGAYAWNECLRPEFRAHSAFVVNDTAARGYRSQGFGAVLGHRFDGMARGSGALVLLGREKEHLMIVKGLASQHFSFRKGSSNQPYPSSLMGGISLLRQTYLDADWYKRHGYKEETNLSLAAWNELSGLPAIFDVRDRLEELRASRLGDEFGVKYILKGRGDEYMRIDELRATGCWFILPLNFPKPFDVEDPYDAEMVSLADMKHWELAPSNPGRLAHEGMRFALTMNGLKKREEFLPNLRKAIRYGLSKTDALKALTATPAEMLGATNDLGSLEPGRYANFFIASGDIFEKDAVMFQTWVRGNVFEYKPLDEKDLRGTYNLMVGNTQYSLLVEGTPEKLEAKTAKDSTGVEVKLNISPDAVSILFAPDKSEPGQTIRLTGVIDGTRWNGIGRLADGSSVKWSAERTAAFTPKEEEKKKEEEELELGNVIYPFVAYGQQELPKAQTYLVKNATVWTNEQEGILKNTDVLINNGRIAEIGKDIAPGGTIVIDGTGKHLTNGIIDEHSHIAISSGVNEGTQECTSEVRIGDVVNSEDINIYRDLSGGVVISQLLHGSANPIGGQSAIIKLRWGYAPEKMKYEGAPGFIKFALGENVKQANWGDNATTRYPQTRMGVEQVFDAYFARAKEYGENKDRNKRRDLEMDALLEIMNKQRFITCHSYVQSEINMLMKVAEKYGFKINTFTHILEGFKVADKMAKHGVGGSTFSDWWAYKMEVKDAIPYNAYFLNKMGVVTAINSDDAEMSRRLNQEAAKSLKYGGMSEEDAWKMVTLNPAKLLHLDDKTGSIKVGKSADLVLWSDYPLSMYAKAEKTWIDGICFFDRQQDLQMRAEIQRERTRLITKMLEEKAGGSETRKPSPKQQKLWECEDIEDEMR